MQLVRPLVMITLFACGSVATNQPDASIDTASCVPDTDMELCAAKNACESQPIVDNCGTERTVDCGACAGGQGCVAGTCKTPVCTSFDFTSAPVPGMARPDIEDSIGAVTPDAQVILYVQTATTSTNGCGAFKLVVADETAPGASTYTQRDVSTSFTMLGLINGQDAYAISADGLTVIALSMDRKKLLATKRSAINAVDFGPASDADFVNVNMQTLAASKTFSSPVLSADGLELWYSVRDTAMNKTTPPRRRSHVDIGAVPRGHRGAPAGLESFPRARHLVGSPHAVRVRLVLWSRVHPQEHEPAVHEPERTGRAPAARRLESQAARRLHEAPRDEVARRLREGRHHPALAAMSAVPTRRCPDAPGIPTRQALRRTRVSNHCARLARVTTLRIR